MDNTLIQKKINEEYWIKKLNGIGEQSPIFPYDLSKNGTCERFRIEIPGEIIQEMNLRFSDEHAPANKFLVYLSVLKVLYYKYTCCIDIVIGTSDLKFPGLFEDKSRLIFLRSNLNENTSIRDLVIQEQQTLLEAFENHNFEFNKMISRYRLNNNGTEKSLFYLGFYYNKLNTQCELLNRFDVLISIFEENNKGMIEIKVGSKIEEYFICNFVRNFICLLKNALISSNSKLRDIEFLSHGEKALLEKFSSQGLVFPVEKTLVELFENQVKQSQETVVLVYKNRHISYQELNEKANQLAGLLRTKGVRPDTIVGLFVKPSIEMILALLGILKAGGAYLPIDPEYPEERVKYMLEDSQPNILISNINKEQVKNYMPSDIDIEIIDIRDETIYRYSGDTNNLTHINKITDLVYIIYTSGSSGKPKGVMLEHKNVVNLIEYDKKYTNMDFSSILQFHTISFDASFHEIFCAFLSGGTLYLIDIETRYDIPKLLEIVGKYMIKTVFLPMSVLKMVFLDKELIDQIPGSIKHIQTAGEQVIVNDNFKKYLKNNNVYLHNHYGPSETHVVTTITIDPQKEIPQFPSIGKPISNTSIYILDKKNTLLPFGFPGDLCVGGAQVGRGYKGNEKLTAEKFIVSPFKNGEKLYKTGDFARWMPDGNIEFLGRIDDQVKIRGFRVEPGEIENHLRSHKEIKDVVVLTKENQKREKYLCAYILSTREIPGSELRAYLSEKLPNYMIPSHFVRIDTIPFTPNGKVDKRALLSIEVEEIAEKEIVFPRNKVEEKLAIFWREVLEKNDTQISIDANFFEQGGHSLKAAILVSKIHKEFNVIITLGEMYKQPTIRNLAEFIKRASSDIFCPLNNVEKMEYYPLSSAQKRLFFLWQLEPKRIDYNMPNFVILEGELSKERIEKTFCRLIERHEILRTSFIILDGQPFQKIADKINFELKYFSTSEDKAKEIVKHYIKPFDLKKTPLLNIKLIRIGETSHILLMDMHHIITDGISMGIFVKEFMALNGGLELSPVGYQYKDYSEWQNSESMKTVKKQQENYWVKQFEGELPVLNLPTDFERLKRSKFEGKMVLFEIEKEDMKQLNDMANKRDVSLYILLLTMFYILLSKESDQEDIIVGTYTSGRGHADLENTIGMFLNTLALRNFPSAEKTFLYFLREVKEKTLTAFENQDYQFEELVNRLNIENVPNRNPIFDVVFALQNFDFPEVKLPGLTLIPYKTDLNIAKFDMHWFCTEGNENLSIAVEYNTSLFKKVTIERFIQDFLSIVSSILNNPDIKIEEIETISTEEQKDILYQFSENLEDN
jgi:amino acid adenylation domain-containing protein